MSSQRCGAQLERAGHLATCDKHVVGHPSEKHSAYVNAEFVEWPACSQWCIQNHQHGKYRRKGGGTVQSAASRLPKPDKPRKSGGRQCSICLEPGTAATLKDGRCADQEACLARAPQLGIGMEA